MNIRPIAVQSSSGTTLTRHAHLLGRPSSLGDILPTLGCRSPWYIPPDLKMPCGQRPSPPNFDEDLRRQNQPLLAMLAVACKLCLQPRADRRDPCRHLVHLVPHSFPGPRWVSHWTCRPCPSSCASAATMRTSSESGTLGWLHGSRQR
jgi:hypothetical protein